MISVSTDWKETLGCYQTLNRPNVIPESFIKIEYDQHDRDAQESVTPTATGSASWSDVSEITDLDITYGNPYITLESNAWILNGKATFLGAQDAVGYVSNELSGNAGTYTSAPVITLTWSSTQTNRVGGLDIVWSTEYNEYAVAYTIRVYQNNVLKKQNVFTNNYEVQNFASLELVNYDKITITIDKWCVPNHRARIESITIGQLYIMTKENVMSMTHVIASDPASLELPDEHLTFEIPNVNQEWNPDNPHGKYQYLLQRQRITLSCGLDLDEGVEWIKSATYYLSEWDIPQNGMSAKFTARSLVDFMNMKYVVPTSAPTNLKTLAESAFGQANLPTDDEGHNLWEVHNSLASYSITLPNDFSRTCAEVIQLCANAGKCIIQTDVNGKVHIKPINEELTDYMIDRFVSYDNTEYTITQPLYKIDINDGYYTSATYDTEGEVQQIDNELIQNGNQAGEVANWISTYLSKRKTISGTYRPDERLQALDLITVQNKYATNTVYITSITYDFNGAFKGTYEGKVMKYIPNEDLEGLWYSTSAEELYSGGVWG